jgi:4-hydroxythreonine-4-phosphate dehydrogenase
MEVNNRPVVGISCGDLNGIGTEVILKSFEDSRILEFFTPLIFSNLEFLLSQAKNYKLNLTFNKINLNQRPRAGKINVIDVWDETFKLEFGKSTKESGNLSFLSLEAVVKAINNNVADIMVTAPINKQNIQNEKFDFPGHTGYLSKQFKGESLMFMVSEELKLGLLTDHIPLKDIVSKINFNVILNKIKLIENSLKIDFGINKPKIAVLSINPHVGDGGVIGNEDDTLLIPALLEASKLGSLISGPFPSDSFFGSGAYKKYDAVLAMYHDQGLVPFKTLSFGEGVNYTAGLNIVRTSPDHGTGYDIAGKNKANPASFKKALFLGIEIFKMRKNYQKLLKPQL